jgi:uncharacterized membrane protein
MPAAATPHDGGHVSSLGFERLVLFSDAVFAIVITLLVLPLTGAVADLATSHDLADDLTDLWPQALSFVVTFLVIGQFWIAHHAMFGVVRSYDRTLLWMNIVALLTVSFLPFPSALLGARSMTDDRLPVVLYAASLTLASMALTTTWHYALRRGLVAADAGDGERRDMTLRSYATTAVFALSILAAFAGLVVAATFWVVLVPLGQVLAVRSAHRRATRR